MQKVEGSSPFSRSSRKAPEIRGFSFARTARTGGGLAGATTRRYQVVAQSATVGTASEWRGAGPTPEWLRVALSCPRASDREYRHQATATRRLFGRGLQRLDRGANICSMGGHTSTATGHVPARRWIVRGADRRSVELAEGRSRRHGPVRHIREPFKCRTRSLPAQDQDAQ